MGDNIGSGSVPDCLLGSFSAVQSCTSAKTKTNLTWTDVVTYYIVTHLSLNFNRNCDTYRHQMIQVTISRRCKLECSEANVIQGFIINTKCFICIFDQLMYGQCSVVRLNNCIGYLGLWQFGLWSFQMGGAKSEIFSPKN